MGKTHSHDTASARYVRLRKRPDITAIQQRFAHRRYWVLKDPISLRYAQLNEHEYCIWECLDGQVSLNDIKQHFERRFTPLQVTQQQIHGFLGDLHQKGLVLADAHGQADRLLERDQQRRGRELLGAVAGILSIRFRGVNPDSFLNWLYPLCRPLFSRLALVASVILALVALTLVAVQFQVLLARLPDFHAFFGATNLVWIALALGATKILHELGHGLVCKHFGGPCHELGVMFLVFVPCLYCNVSDAWMLPSKWHRIAITAAGLWVEMTLASLCTLLWWFSEPGLLNTLCLNTMFVCSISAVLFNGNPLLRFDGYFILSDALEMPNLWQESRDYLRSLARRWCLGVEQYGDLAWLHSRRRWLALYGLASTMYRWVVLVGIMAFLFEVLRPYRLEILARGLLVVVVVGILVAPVAGGWRFMRNPINRGRVRRVRLAVTCLLLAGAAAGIYWIPAPFHLAAPLVLQPKDAHRVYVSVPGELDKVHVKAGETVAQDDRLATLTNLELTREIKRLEGELRQQQTHLDNLQARRSTDPDASLQIPTAEKMLDDMHERLEKNREEQDKLVLIAPAAGVVLPPPDAGSGQSVPGRLPTWSGTPLDEENRGCLLETGTVFCLIGEPSRLEAVLYVDQTDIQFLRLGQPVRLRLDTLPGKVLEGTIVEVAQKDAKVAPRELATVDLPVRVSRDGVARPVDAAYQARVSLDEHDYHLPIGSRGKAKVVVQPQPLGRRLFRYLSRTFRFRL